jgi:uncharacterized membrane protein
MSGHCHAKEQCAKEWTTYPFHDRKVNLFFNFKSTRQLAPMKRLPSIDIARGLVMVIMALDHARDLLHVDAAQLPTDLATTTPLLFFTRWITHLCAPSFVFLSGTSAWLWLESTPDKAAGRRFLLTRGLALVGIEFTIVNFGMFFDPRFRTLIFEVIATIGAGMVLLSFLSRLPLKVIIVLAVLIIFGHDLLDAVDAPTQPAPKLLYSLLFALNVFPFDSDRVLVVAYPILPWLGIMLAGFAAGRIFTLPTPRRKTIFIRSGLAALALFILLRWINRYGDPFPWTAQKNGLFTFLSFLNVNKYPPSLLFTLVTLGILLLVLAAAEGRDNRATRWLLVYGRVPLFYFIVHFYLIHLILILVDLAQGHPWATIDFSTNFGRPKGGGLPIGGVYLVWGAVVLTMYPLSRWYGRYKAAHREKKWLRYL